MDEYIKREAVIEAIMSEPSDAHYPQWYVDKIKSIPAADVAEVVRCKDWGDEAGELQRSDGVLFARCKVHNYLIDGRHTGWCPTENDFCSFGERKEGVD